MEAGKQLARSENERPDLPIPSCDTVKGEFARILERRTIMKRNILNLLALAGSGLVAVALVFAASVPTVGSKAPGFTLPSQEGKQVSLKDFNGKWVVLYFYPKDFTQGCTIEAHNFQEDQSKFTALNAAIVGVSADTVDSHKDFCTKENLTFKTLADPTLTTIDAYGSKQVLEGKMKEALKQDAIATRNTFLIDPQGVIRKVYEKVNPNPHSKEVLADLATLQK
jgi:thioredoxin-dependent peroxiredoxin